MITLPLLQTLCPRTKKDILTQYTEPLEVIGEYYDLFDDKKRIAGFLSQIIHESGGFNFTIENLNYNAVGLRKTFPRYFPTDVLAAQYAKQPEKIANRVYANRMANGDEASGDGWKFRGRGLIQITGRNNYTMLAEALELSIEETITYMETAPGGASSAGWFWDINDLNTYCDKSDFIGLTKRINGGTNGLAERKAIYDLAIKTLQG